MFNSKPRRIRITHLHKEDACYHRKEEYIGQTGEFTVLPCLIGPPGYFAGSFVSDAGDRDMTFHGIRYIRI